MKPVSVALNQKLYAKLSILLNVLSFYLLANRFLSIIFDADLKPARETMPCPKKSA